MTPANTNLQMLLADVNSDLLDVLVAHEFDITFLAGTKMVLFSHRKLFTLILFRESARSQQETPTTMASRSDCWQ
jgi:hypothetical protein